MTDSPLFRSAKTAATPPADAAGAAGALTPGAGGGGGGGGGGGPPAAPDAASEVAPGVNFRALPPYTRGLVFESSARAVGKPWGSKLTL